MAMRTSSDPRYYLRFLLIGAVALGFALWSLYDGAVTYPNQQERALAHKKFKDENHIDQWPDYARERGWPTVSPGVPKTDVDIILQYVMAAVTGAIGFPLLLNAWRSRGRWIELSDTQLSSSWGQTVDLDSVVSLDKKRWRNKGIARITYQDGKRRRRFVLDDFKFDRPTTDQILSELEARIGADKIIGGPPEPPAEEPTDGAPDLMPTTTDNPE
jgi:hypothetical protein